MENDTARPTPAPPRPTALSDSYAVHVGEAQVNVWQYRVNISEPDGEWFFVEALDRDNDPKLSMDHATPMPPSEGGYWIYSRTYDCELDCE